MVMAVEPHQSRSGISKLMYASGCDWEDIILALVQAM